MDGLRKVSKKPEDEWDEWGLDLEKPTHSGAGGRGSLLGRKPKKDDGDDDALDNIIDHIE